MSKLKGKARAKASKKNKNKQKNDFFLRMKRLIGEIRKYDNPELSVECDVVFKGEDIKDIFKKMMSVLNATSNGVGLAASQIGISKKIIIVKPDSDSRNITCMINPEIKSTSNEKKYGREGCLSYPETFAFIERYTSVIVSYHDENWKEHTVEYKEGEILSIVVQHEMEHLDYGHCQIYDWWKDPEKKQKELEEKLKSQEKKSSTYDIVESEDMKKEKEEAEKEDVELFPIQKKMVENFIEKEDLNSIEKVVKDETKND